MHAMWLYLKDNAKCGSKLSDVLCRPEKCSNKKNFTSEEKNWVLDCQLVHPIATPIRQLIYRQNYSQTRLYELEVGDPSRKIIEMIFQKASLDPSRSTSRIKSVLKVKNSIQTFEAFEKYREKVKMIANDRCLENPRNKVDGNEQLRFYGTTIACRREKSKRVSELCKNPTCRVCRILQSNFGIEYTLNNGIQLSSSSEDFSENAIPVMKMKNMERAVIVCRTIAGSVSSINNEEYNTYDSIGNNKGDNSGNVIVWNPSALLPCFVIVFS